MKAPDRTERVRGLGITAWTSVGIIILLGFVLYGLYNVQTVLMPFFYALVFVYVLRPVVNALDNKGVPRIVALIIAYLGMLSVLTLLGIYVGPILFKEGNSLVSKFPGYIANLNLYILDLIERYPFLRGSEARNLISGFEASFRSFAQSFALSVPAITATFFGGVFNIVLAPIIAFYILKDFSVIRETVSGLIPERHRREGMQIIRKVDCIVGGFMKGQALIALSVGVLSCIALAVLGIDYAILLGFLIGVFNIIPYLGPILGGAPAVIIALGTSWQLALAVVVVLLAIQQLDSIVISPRIMSQQVHLHPVVIIFALLLGGTLFGFVGMLIAIPIAAVGKALLMHFRERNNGVELEESESCEIKEPARL